MGKIFKRDFLKSDNGAAAIEAIFIIPFLCFLFFSSEDLTSMIKFNKQMTDVAQVVSDTVAQTKSTITAGQLTDYYKSVQLLLPSAQASNAHVDVYDYYLNGTTLTKRWSSASSGGSSCATPNTTNYSNMMANGNDVIVAVSCMAYTPWVGTFMGGPNVLGATSFTLTQTVAATPYLSKTIVCSGGTSC